MRVYVGGTFDLFHPGHVRLLKYAKNLARDECLVNPPCSVCSSYVIVVVNTDEFVKRYKGQYPVMSLGERVECLLSCRFVDEVWTNERDEDSRYMIERVGPEVILHGDDRTGKGYLEQ